MILLDSSLIVAYSNEADENHEKALKIVKNLERGKYRTPAITDYIFDEIVTVMFVKTKNLKKVIELGEALLNSTLLFRVRGDISLSMEHLQGAAETTVKLHRLYNHSYM